MFIIYLFLFLPIFLITVLVIIASLKLTSTMLNSVTDALEETLKENK